jgi:TolB protein
MRLGKPTALLSLPLLFAPDLEAQGRRRVFSKIMTGEPYILECYLPQITNGPNYPSWSPDGRQIAFGMKGSIWRIRLGETTAHELTSGRSYDSMPAWHPGGRYIVYTAEANEEIHLQLLDFETGESRQLTSGVSINVEPEWSPDGSRLAYVSSWPNGNYNIWLMPFDGGSHGKPYPITRDFELVPPTVYYGKWAVHIHPTWMPDGKELILITNRDNKHGSGGFYSMTAEPDAPPARFHYEETTWRARPTISPDGAKMVYSSYLGRQWQQLWAMPPKGGDAFPLTYGEFDRTSPRWSPDGARIAFISNETGDTSLWLFHWFGGKLEQVKIDKLVHRRPMGRLRVRILDAATGRPTAARVHLHAADGRSYAPRESWPRVDWIMYDHMDAEEYHFFHTAGEFEMDLPPGKTELKFSKGFEHLPEERQVNVREDAPASLTVTLKRLDRARDKGWWDGANHFHMNYSGVYYNPPERQMFQAEAEDISVLNNLICNKEQRIPDIAYFTGKPDPVSRPGRILFHNQEYHPPFWGHAAFLNLKQHYVIPDYVGYQNTIVASLYPSNTTAFQVARAQGALAGYAHGAGRNFAADLALDNVDFIEVNTIEGMEPLYRAWNCGYRVVASAGEDAFGNFYRSYIIGSNRVYVKTGKTLDYDKWIADFRAGRSFVSAGPLVYFTVNGKEPGDEISLPAGSHSLRAVAEVRSIMPIEKIELLFNNQVVAKVAPSGQPLQAKLDQTITVNGSGWLAVRTRARDARHPIRRPFPFAATMPVWVTVGGQPVRSREDAQYFVAWIDRVLKEALAAGPWNNEWEKDEIRTLYQEARARLQRRSEERR